MMSTTPSEVYRIRRFSAFHGARLFFVVLCLSAWRVDLRAQSPLHPPVVEIELCRVENPENAPDSATAVPAPSSLVQKLVSKVVAVAPPSLGHGRVDYNYAIGKYDVTVAQYTAFLNAVARNDPYKLYDPLMAATGNVASPSTGAGIKQSGPAGSYTYAVIGDSGNNPVSFVSWLDAARFCNWLHNGQPTDGVERAGTTETGAYTLNGDTTSGFESRNAGAQWWIPSEDEWHKAAYYDPTLNNGTGGYWKYATKSNTPPGNIVGGGANQANYRVPLGYSVTQKANIQLRTNYLTPVGSFKNSASFYGTYDQNGNVFQWNEAIGLIGKNGQKGRGMRGGSWLSWEVMLESETPIFHYPSYKGNETGFRVATEALGKGR
jgi:formylglycine-generating enzyme required for sulfatase activity